ncbi:MAG: radical SAM protein [bacterium]
MKIWLIRPGSSMGRRVGSHALQHPIGLCYLAAAARREGYDVRIIDLEVERWVPERFTRELREEQPAIVGFTAMTPVIESAAAIASAVKKVLPAAKTVVGGAHASALPVRTLEEFSDFDAAVAGEGEIKFIEICRAVADNQWAENPIPLCALRSGGEITDFTHITAQPIELDSLPMPERGILKLNLYHGAPTPGILQRATQLFTTRGCACHCIFCAAHSLFGRSLRFRSVESLMNEIRQCVGTYNIRHFTIDDDAFTFDRARVMNFCEEAAKIGITWDCDARVDHVDGEMLKAMASAGCRKIAYGVESGSQRILNQLKKDITIEQINEAFHLTRKAGIMSCAFLMVGSHPEETAEDNRLTRDLIKKIKPDLISAAVTTPFPGTALRMLMEHKGLLPSVPWSAYAQTFTACPFTRTHSLSPQDLLRIQRSLLRTFYLRPGYIIGRILRLRSLAELLYWFKAGTQFVLYIMLPRNKYKKQD